MASSALAPVSAFSGVIAALQVPSGGVRVKDRDALCFAAILVRQGKEAALAERIRTHMGIDLPTGPRRAAKAGLGISGIRPGGWLVTCEGGGNEYAARLAALVGDTASVSDQSDAYAALQLSGPAVRETLAKLLPLDLHPREFAVGDVATCAVGEIGVILWRLDDDAAGDIRFEMAITRSMALSFWQALSDSAAEFGFART